MKNNMTFSGAGRHFALAKRSIVLALCIILLFSYELWRSHNAAREEGERTVSNLVHVMSEQVARTIQSIDLNLQDIAIEISNKPTLADNDEAFRASLHKRLSTLPYVRALFVIGEDGFISHDTDFPTTPHVSLADRDYFLTLRDNTNAPLYMSRPLKSRSLGVWFISLSRPVIKENGSFGGVVVAAVEPLYFERFYRQLWEESGTILLALDDGTLLARSPENEKAMGASFANVEPFRSLLSQHRQGIFWDNSPIDQVFRVMGFQRLDAVPVIVMMTLNHDDVMKGWRKHASVAALGLAILLILLVTLEWLSQRARRREEHARMSLERGHRLAAIGRFSGGFAHDIGNLMRIVSSGVVVLRRGMAETPAALAVLDEIDQSLVAGRHMISRLLAQAGNEENVLERLDINGIISDALPILRQAAGPLVVVVTVLAENDAICLIDKSHFQSAIVNLIFNARDAMPSGGKIVVEVRVALESGSRTSYQWVDISVSDEGSGITEDVRKHAFDPFYTTKDFGSGSGVGLSQVLEFAHRCGGRVDILNRENVGVTVRLRLPLDGQMNNSFVTKHPARIRLLNKVLGLRRGD